ncbi:hypothetical protein [Alteriqipengyuania sp. 357]
MKSEYEAAADHMLDAASITCGGIFAGYLGVQVGSQATITQYFYLTGMFITAILVASSIYLLTRANLLLLLPGIAFSLFCLIPSAFVLVEFADRVGIDTDVIFCVLVAWLLVPGMALCWGIAARRAS